MIINSLKYNDDEYFFVNDSKSDESKFTILVGKNGSGKSEIIRQIISAILRAQLPKESDSIYRDRFDDYLDNTYKDMNSQRESSLTIELSILINNNEYSISFEKTNQAREFKNHLGQIEFIQNSNYRYADSVISENKHTDFNAQTLGSVNIIAASTSQFDKFPILQSMRHQRIENFKYSYLGATTDEIRSYEIDHFVIKNMKVFCSYIFKIILEKKVFNFEDVFKYLGFKGIVKIFYSLKHDAKSFNPESITTNKSPYLKSSIAIDQSIINGKEEQEIRNAINFLSTKDEASSFHFKKIDDANCISIDFTQNMQDKLTKSLGLLSKHGLIDFHTIEFCSDSSHFLFSQASSGQLCILLNVFGIASRIESDSLILIDEPELSLHPKWQEDFLPLVKSVFEKYKRCHYVVATHSPQIASSLNDEHSTILKIGDGTLLKSTDVFKNSIDYQLANIFGAPAFNNDYLAKELIKILTQISQKGEISHSLRMRIKPLKKSKGEIKSNDPLHKLYKMLDLAESKYKDGH